MLVLPSSALLLFNTKAAFTHVWLGACPSFYDISLCPRPVKVLHCSFAVLSSQTGVWSHQQTKESKDSVQDFHTFQGLKG